MKKSTLLIVALFASFVLISQNIEDRSHSQLQTSLYDASAPIFLGDTIFVVDSSISYSYSTEIIPVRKTWYQTRNIDAQQTFTINYLWSSIDEVFYPKSSDSVVYFENGIVNEEYTSLYFKVSDAWVASSFTLYNEEGLEMIGESKNWDVEIGAYYSGHQTVNAYNENDDFITIQTNEYNPAGDNWVNEKLAEYFRDENGNDTLLVVSAWDSQNENWIAETKTVKIYNTQNNIIFDEYYTWDEEAEIWLFPSKTEYVYNELGDMDTMTSINWDFEDEFWYYDHRQILTYDDNSVLNQLVYQNYILLTEFWHNDIQLLWEYENDKLVTYMKDEWVNGFGWLGETETHYILKEERINDTIISKHFCNENGDWSVIERYSTVPNENGTANNYHQEIINDGGEWETSYRNFFYYSSFILPEAISEYNEIDFRVFPNPTKGEIVMEIPEEFKKNAIAYVSDINGRVIKVLPITNSNKIDLGSEQPGVYFIRLTNGNQTGTKRVVLY